MTNHDLANLDPVIDSVARQMTDADPTTGLRGRVLAQLADRPASPWMWRLMPAAAVLLAVVWVAVVLIGRSHPSIPSMEPQMEAAAAVPPASSVTSDTRESAAPATLIAKASLSESKTSRITDAHAAWEARALPPLAQPEVLTVGDIQPEALSIRPLETRPVVIAPMGTDEGGF